IRGRLIGLRQRDAVLPVDFVSGIWFNLVPRSLTLMVSEEICGRFGSFDEQTTAHISNYLARPFGD
ncbi:hypothetical protein, partial [Aliiroseovarius sp. xm-m-339-2]